MGTPDIRPCRSGRHEYDHARYRTCPGCKRESHRDYDRSPKGKQVRRDYRSSPKGKQAKRKGDRKSRKNHPMALMANHARTGLRGALKACGADKAAIQSADQQALLTVPSAVLAEVAGGNGYADWQDEGLEVKLRPDVLRPTQWARAVLNYRNGLPYRVVYIEPMPDGRDIRHIMFETVFTFYDWQQEQARLERESAAPDADPVDTNADL